MAYGESESICDRRSVMLDEANRLRIERLQRLGIAGNPDTLMIPLDRKEAFVEEFMMLFDRGRGSTSLFYDGSEIRYMGMLIVFCDGLKEVRVR